MSYLKINIVFVLFLLYFLRTNRKGLHILQLEHYYKDRYIKWMEDNFNIVFNLKKIVLLLILSIVLIINSDIGFVLTIITYCLLFLTIPMKKEKKPFVVTKRVKRQLLVYLILVVIFGILINVFNDVLGIVFLNVISMISYMFVYIVALITTPIEKSINKKFCKKASQKLKEIPNMNVIGITGSFGKTSTKHIINTIFVTK